MEYPIAMMKIGDVSALLPEIPDAPDGVYVRGNLPPTNNSCLAVVGSRNYSNYGKQVVDYLISGLRGYPISIISGLALGIDALAHEAALNAGLHTLAVPGSGIDDSVIYPRRNFGLAQKILESGGGLLSEFEPTFRATTWSFPQRNRIMVGLSHAVLLIEASEKSGTLITARLTAEYNRDLLVVPGNIFLENSFGVHQFLKLGATPVTTPVLANRYQVNLPAASTAGTIGLSLLGGSYLVDLELSAAQAEGRGEVISAPRVITANQKQATIIQGTEIPYQEAASSGATTTQFKKAVLSLKVTPLITPDNRVILDLDISKDSVGQNVQSATGGSVPSIDTREIITQVLVNDGQTVVLGGVLETTKNKATNKVPFLGDIPFFGYLFKQTADTNNKKELLIFITPKIMRDGSNLY